MKKYLVATLIFFLLCLWQVPAWACLSCNRPLQVSIFEENFWRFSFYLILPLVVAGIVAGRLHKLK